MVVELMGTAGFSSVRARGAASAPKMLTQRA
jgi:hypothetical protein